MPTESSSLQADFGPAGSRSTDADRRWRRFITPSALLIEIPVASALIAAALLATLPGQAGV
jgi:hypothetical protein